MSNRRREIQMLRLLRILVLAILYLSAILAIPRGAEASSSICQFNSITIVWEEMNFFSRLLNGSNRFFSIENNGLPIASGKMMIDPLIDKDEFNTFLKSFQPSGNETKEFGLDKIRITYWIEENQPSLVTLFQIQKHGVVNGFGFVTGTVDSQGNQTFIPATNFHYRVPGRDVFDIGVRYLAKAAHPCVIQQIFDIIEEDRLK